MIDTLPRSHAAIFNDRAERRLPPSFYWGAAVALVLHAGIAAYLVMHTFAQAPAAQPPVTDQPVVVSMTPPVQQPKPQPAPPPKNVVPVHATPTPLDPTTETLKVSPQTDVKGDPGPTPALVQTPVNGTGVSVSSSSDGPVVPRWTRFPDGNALSQYYPARALDNEVEGSATVRCTVLDVAGRVSCIVAAETPKNYGFGAATVKMVEEKGRVDTTQGDIRPGSVLADATVKWQLN